MRLASRLHRRGWTAVAAVLLAVFAAVLVAPSPAAASTCGTPGCGGKVFNQTSGSYVYIVNCWHDWTDSWQGSGTPPCVTNGYSQYKWNAAWFVNPGQNSEYNIPGGYYYDVDAFYAPAGCTTYGYFSGPMNFSYNRHGTTGLWKRVYGTDEAVITAIVC